MTRFGLAAAATSTSTGCRCTHTPRALPPLMHQQTLTHWRTIPVNEGVNRLLTVPGDRMWCATNANIIIYSPEVRMHAFAARCQHSQSLSGHPSPCAGGTHGPCLRTLLLAYL